MFTKTFFLLFCFSLKAFSQEVPIETPPMEEPEKNTQEFERYFQTEVSGKPEGVFIVTSKAATVYPIPDENSNPVTVLQKGQKIHAVELREDWIKVGHKEWILRKEAKSLGWKTMPTNVISQ